MKKIIIAIMLIGIMASPILAQQTNEVTGTVDSINPIDPERGDYDGGIDVRDASGRVLHAAIDTSTSILDESGNTIKSVDIEDGDTVKVSYSASDNGNIAVNISRIVDKYR